MQDNGLSTITLAHGRRGKNVFRKALLKAVPGPNRIPQAFEDVDSLFIDQRSMLIFSASHSLLQSLIVPLVNCGAGEPLSFSAIAQVCLIFARRLSSTP